MKVLYFLLFVLVALTNAQRQQQQQRPQKACNGIKHESRNGKNYFFSWLHEPTKNAEVDWFMARNFCVRNCMRLVSLESPAENHFVKQRLAQARQKYIWTSGTRPEGQGNNPNAWFWSGSGVRIGPTNSRAAGDWSHTGGGGRQQPDNRELEMGKDETCLAVLNNFYNDGIKWHDVGCNHLKPFVCED